MYPCTYIYLVALQPIQALGKPSNKCNNSYICMHAPVQTHTLTSYSTWRNYTPQRNSDLLFRELLITGKKMKITQEPKKKGLNKLQDGNMRYHIAF